MKQTQIKVRYQHGQEVRTCPIADKLSYGNLLHKTTTVINFTTISLWCSFLQSIIAGLNLGNPVPLITHSFCSHRNTCKYETHIQDFQKEGRGFYLNENLQGGGAVIKPIYMTSILNTFCYSYLLRAAVPEQFYSSVAQTEPFWQSYDPVC